MVTVVVLPELGSPSTLNWRDVRVDTFRATGPGGQHRNTTDSGVRLTHRPTGTVVTATEDRSQHVNRRVAGQRLVDALARADAAHRHAATNIVRAGSFGSSRSFTWTGWRDRVRSSDGRSTGMRQALAGRLGPLVRH